MAHTGFSPSRKVLFLDDAGQHFACFLAIWRTQRAGSKFKWRLTENRLGMAEIDKAFMAVISACARRANAAKRRIVLHDMRNHVIHRHTARSGGIDDFIFFSLIVAEIIQTQRTVMVIDITNRFIGQICKI